MPSWRFEFDLKKSEARSVLFSQRRPPQVEQKTIQLESVNPNHCAEEKIINPYLK
jgi:hypothetical protein